MRFGQIFILVCLLFISVPVYAGDNDLFDAAYKGNVSALDKLLRESDTVDTVNKNGLTPLWAAVAQNHLDAVRFLLKHGANPNDTRSKNFSLIFHAARENTEILQVLLDGGADINFVTPDNETALHNVIAMWCGSACIEYSKKHHAKIRQKTDITENVKFLIQAGADVNKPGQLHETPLRAAIRLNNVPVISLLLEAKADVHEKLLRGQGNLRRGSPLMDAIDWYSHFKDIRPIELLLQHGADPNDGDENAYDDFERSHGETWAGNSVLTYSANRGFLPVVKLLLQYGADLNKKRSDGVSAEELARKNGHMKVAELLEERAKTPKK